MEPEVAQAREEVAGSRTVEETVTLAESALEGAVVPRNLTELCPQEEAPVLGAATAREARRDRVARQARVDRSRVAHRALAERTLAGRLAAEEPLAQAATLGAEGARRVEAVKPAGPVGLLAQGELPELAVRRHPATVARTDATARSALLRPTSKVAWGPQFF